MQKYLGRIAARWKVWVPVVVVVLAAFGIGLTVEDRDGDGQPDKVIIELPVAPPATAVDGPDQDVKPDDALPLDAEAQEVAEGAAQARPGSEMDGPLREKGDGPAGVLEGPLASQEFPGCRTRFVGNFSSRAGQKPQEIVWHYTVSRNRPGWSDVDGLTAFANQRSSGVSWHFLIDREGHCNFTVPLNMKAWTQANANPFSIGIEVIAFGDEPTYIAGKGRAKLLSVTRELGRRFGIPMRRGQVSSCRPTRSGIVAHVELGACGGGHRDINPFMDEFAPLIAAAKAGECTERCRSLRKRHEATHRELRNRRCAPAARTRSERCRFLHSRNRAVHAAARRDGVRL